MEIKMSVIEFLQFGCFVSGVFKQCVLVFRPPVQMWWWESTPLCRPLWHLSSVR